jgi:hypothetical protein
VDFIVELSNVSKQFSGIVTVDQMSFTARCMATVTHASRLLKWHAPENPVVCCTIPLIRLDEPFSDSTWEPGW